MSVSTPSRHDAWDRSAQEYAAFADRSQLYRDTAAALVRLAGIRPGMTVVDLACGTGVVSETVLSQWPDGVRIVATDFAPLMIATARARIPSRHVTFHCEGAEHLSRVAPAQVDRVLCNAAFWQFDQERALSEIAKVLKDGGKCLLSLPAALPVMDRLEVLYREHKLLWMIVEEMSIRGYQLGAPAPRLPRPAALDASGRAEGFRVADGTLRLEATETMTVPAVALDYLEFLRIPVMLKRFSTSMGVPEHEMADIMEVVRQELRWVDMSAPPQIWKIVTLRKVEA
jgi:ubiquinone/menaquinone biosynthesis C-methylase UbiE